MACHTSVFLVLLATASFGGALRQDTADGLEFREIAMHEADTQRARPYDRLCCLQAVEPVGGMDDVEGDPNVEAIHLDVVKETAKCILVMLPLGCQGGVSATHCKEACTEAFKNNPAWYEKVSVEAGRQLESTQKLSTKEQQVAQATRDKALKKCQSMEAGKKAEAQRKKEHDVRPLFDELSQTVLARKEEEDKWVDLSEVSVKVNDLESEIQRMTSDFDDSVKTIASDTDDCTSNASSAYEEVLARTEASNSKAAQNLESWQKKLAAVSQQKETENNSSKVELGTVGACDVKGKVKDCCCSFREPAGEDGHHAEGQAMRVKAGQFAHWEHCYAAQPYTEAKTGLFGLFGGCNYYTKCDACWKLLCPGGRMCP